MLGSLPTLKKGLWLPLQQGSLQYHSLTLSFLPTLVKMGLLCLCLSPLASQLLPISSAPPPSGLDVAPLPLTLAIPTSTHPLNPPPPSGLDVAPLPLPVTPDSPTSTHSSSLSPPPSGTIALHPLNLPTIPVKEPSILVPDTPRPSPEVGVRWGTEIWG